MKGRKRHLWGNFNIYRHPTKSGSLKISRKMGFQGESPIFKAAQVLPSTRFQQGWLPLAQFCGPSAS
eukprot:174469-Pelagomonas_calceolata.AAC.5